MLNLILSEECVSVNNNKNIRLALLEHHVMHEEFLRCVRTIKHADDLDMFVSDVEKSGLNLHAILTEYVRTVRSLDEKPSPCEILGEVEVEDDPHVSNIINKYVKERR